MTEKVIRYEDGKFAMYTLADGEGAPNPSTRFTDPVPNSPYVDFHTDFDYMAQAARGSLTVNHPAVAYTTPSGDLGFGGAGNATQYTTDYVLLQHDLGYLPFCMVSIDDVVLPFGFPIQLDAFVGVRYIAPIVTTTQILIREYVFTIAGTLPEISKTYNAFALEIPTTDSEAPDLDILANAANAYFKCANGRIDSTKRYIRTKDVAENGFYLTKGKTADLDSGAIKTIAGDGTSYIDFPARYGGSFTSIDSTAIAFGDDDEYDGANIVDISAAEGLLVVDQGNVVLAAARKAACILQTVDLSNQVFTFPNPTKDYLYTETIAYPTLSTFAYACDSWATLAPNEWTSTIELATLDTSDGDFLLGLARGSQTSAPASYNGDSQLRLMPSSAWIPVTGTIVLSMWGLMKRSISFDIQGDKLVAILQQTIGGINTSGLFAHNDSSSHDIEMTVTYLGQIRTGPIPDALRPLYGENAPNSCPKTTGSNWGEAWTFTDLKFAIGRISGV